jgi:hypothetical protein
MHAMIRRLALACPRDQPQSSNTQLPQRDSLTTENTENDIANVLVTVLTPCLNEARTLAACIQQAQAGCTAAIAHRMSSSPRPASGRGAGGEGFAAQSD